MQKCHMESKQAVVTFSGFIKYSWEAGSWGRKTNNNEPTSILACSGSPSWQHWLPVCVPDACQPSLPGGLQPCAVTWS